MNTKFYISKIQKSARKTIENINCGFDIETTKATIERTTECKVIAIREATAEETETIKTGTNVSF